MGTGQGTVASGGLPPVMNDPDAPPYDTAVVRAHYPEASDLLRGVALFGSWVGRDWQVNLTVKEARILRDGLTEAIAEAESA